jgi:hypothetical protein
MPLHVFTRCVKVTFVGGASLQGVPLGGSAKEARWIDVYENGLDEPQMIEWIPRAAARFGWRKG